MTSLSPASMADVARQAGVSVATVSRALRGSALVSPATAERVRQVADELDFAVSRTASSLASGRLDRVAVLLSGSLAAWFNGCLLDATYAALHDRGQELLIYRTLSREERDAFFTTLPARRNADAMIVASLELTSAQRRRLQNLGMPLVFVNQRQTGAASVAIDDAAGAEVATRHLLDLGHRRVAYVGYAHDPAARPSSARRVTGYRAALAGRRIPVRDQRTCLVTGPDAVEDAVSRLLAAARPPTALFVESDDLAMRVLAALWRMGLRTPADLSVVGFDGHAMAETVGLTTVAQPVSELGRRAAELALDLAAGATPRRRTITVPTTLVLRSTTAHPA